MNIDPRLPEKSIFRFTWQKKNGKKTWEVYGLANSLCVLCSAYRKAWNECHIIVNAYSYSMNEWNNFDKHHIWVHFTIRCLDFLDDLFISKTLLSIFPNTFDLIDMNVRCMSLFFMWPHYSLHIIRHWGEHFWICFRKWAFSEQVIYFINVINSLFGPYSIEIVSNWVPFRYYSIIVWCACFHRE